MQINEEEVRRGVILRRPKGKAPPRPPPRPKSEVFLDQAAAKRRSKRYSAFGVSQSNAFGVGIAGYDVHSLSYIRDGL